MSWPVRILLVIVLIVGFFLEAAAPGLGVFGGIAFIALGVLIGAPLVAGMAEWWEVALVLASMILIAVELFVLPGTGIVGLLGILGFFTGLIFIAGGWQRHQPSGTRPGRWICRGNDRCGDRRASGRMVARQTFR